MAYGIGNRKVNYLPVLHSLIALYSYRSKVQRKAVLDDSDYSNCNYNTGSQLVEAIIVILVTQKKSRRESSYPLTQERKEGVTSVLAAS